MSGLPAPAPRRLLHRRRITVEGFQRDDGLWEIDARLVDTKGHEFDNAWRGRIGPDEPLHDMVLRITVDDEMVIRDISAQTLAGPFEVCPDITGNFQRLIGVRVGPGWNRAVKERLGGVEGCTHLVELLRPMATVLFQTVFPERDRARRVAGKKTSRPPLDACHAMASDGEVVRRHWPEFYKERG